MEKVQFQLEATLPELKDLHEKRLFTKHEIDQITRKRTAFETSLIRRNTRKDDFFKYAEYEINLERLRRVRWKRLNYHINPPPPSASTYSLPRRALYILKRATAKFPGDLAVWLAYVEYASREGMRKVVAKGLNSALQHHPLSSTLYLLLSYHHLHPTSPFPRNIIPSTSTSTLDLPSTSSPSDSGFSLEGTSAARTTILLGLRLLPQSPELWTEYIKLELGWVEALRRRWNVLGISDITSKGDEVDPNGLAGGEGSFGPDGEDARKSILGGQLVIHALTSALEAIAPDDKGLEFRERLIRMLRVYPSGLRGKSLSVIYEDLDRLAGDTGKIAARARLVILTKNLYDRTYEPGQEGDGVVLEGVELVEEIGRLGKEIRKSAKTGGKDWLEVAGGWLSEQIRTQGENDDLREYLLTILSSLTAPKFNPPPSLLLLHLRFLPQSKSDPAKFLAIAKSHAALHSENPALQYIRLNAEISQAESASLRPVFETVVKAVSRPDIDDAGEEDVRKIWFCWTSFEERNAESTGNDLTATWRTILTLSTKLNRPHVHTALLGRYLISTLQRSPLHPIKVIEGCAKYRPSPAFYAIAFAAIAVYSQETYKELSKLYEIWRASARSVFDKSEAGLTWSTWLLKNGKALEATRVVDTLIREDKDVERRWKAILDGVDAGQADHPLSEDKDIKLEFLLADIGWSGLSRPDGLAEVSTEGSEQEEEDEEMESDDEAEEGEESEGESASEDGMEITV